VTDFDPKKPHNELPELPPPADLIETSEILKKCINARVALAELKQAAELIPNAAVLVNALPLLEAQASSEIENIVTTTDKLFEFVEIAEDKADAATKEALRYRTALFEGTKMVRRGMLTIDMAIQICSMIKNLELDLRVDSGTTLTNRKTREVIYTPPVGQKLIHGKLENWADFMHKKTDIDPLYLSRYIIQNKSDYYRLLLSVTHNQAWGDWIMFMLNGVEETCIWTTEKIKAIRELMQHTSQYVQQECPKIYSWEFVESLFKQPYCRINNLVSAGIAKRQTASVYLKQLCDIGVLKEMKSGRETLFVHPKYIELLTGEANVWVYYEGVETKTAAAAE
jgi:Fic family protein